MNTADGKYYNVGAAKVLTYDTVASLESTEKILEQIMKGARNGHIAAYFDEDMFDGAQASYLRFLGYQVEYQKNPSTEGYRYIVRWGD